MAAKRVLVISDEFPPEGGGAGVIAKRLVLDLHEAGHDVTLVCGSNTGGDNRILPESRQYFIRRRTLLWILAYKFRFVRLDLSSFDTIILNDFVAVYLAGLWFGEEVLARCVVVVHGNDSRFVFKRNTRKHRYFHYAKYYLRCIQYCKKVVAVSRYARDLYLDYADQKIEPERVAYCYAGVSSHDFDHDLVITRDQLGLPQESKILFTACRLIEDKGIFNQLDIFARLKESIPEICWLIAGEGEDKERFQQAIERKGLKDQVRLLGFIPRKQLGAYYRLADIFWMLSVRDGETMGLVYLEAALFGTPSIGLKKYGVVEAIKEGESGFFYTPETVMDNVAYCLTIDMSQSCILYAKKYQTKKFADFIMCC